MSGQLWLVSDEWEGTSGYISSINKGRVIFPEKGWKYASTDDENPWIEDENLSIQGSSCFNIIHYICLT